MIQDFFFTLSGGEYWVAFHIDLWASSTSTVILSYLLPGNNVAFLPIFSAPGQDAGNTMLLPPGQYQVKLDGAAGVWALIEKCPFNIILIILYNIVNLC